MFCQLDKAQEHNVQDIKVTYRSEGPEVNWDYFHKLHPAIHTIKLVSNFIDNEFATSRGTSHTVPQREIDVITLQDSYAKSGYHQYTSGRVLKGKGRGAKDYETHRITKIQTSKVLARWRHLRTFECSTEESWCEVGSVDLPLDPEEVDEVPDSEPEIMEEGVAEIPDTWEMMLDQMSMVLDKESREDSD